MSPGCESLQISSAHPALDTRIFEKISRSLARSGRAVSLLVPHHKDEVVESVQIVALPFPGGRLRRFISSLTRTPYRALRSRAPICHFHDPDLIPAGLILKCFGRKVIYDVHEDVPADILTKPWLPRPVRVLVAAGMRFLEWIAGLCFDRIVVVTPGIGRRFPERKTVLIQNYPLPQRLELSNDVSYASRPREVAFVGIIEPGRGAMEMVEAMGWLPSSFDLKLTLAGKFSSDSLRMQLERLPGWQRVGYLGFLSRSEVNVVLQRARAGLVIYQPLPNYDDSQPNKLFEYMSAGIPVIASNFPLWRDVVEGSGAGLLVDPTSPASIVGALEWLLNHEQEAAEMGRRGRRAVMEKYNWYYEERKLLAMYRELEAATFNSVER